jgi:threonine dehydratase
LHRNAKGYRAAAAAIARTGRCARRCGIRAPCRPSAGCDVWLKFENLQFTASFKERGALNKLLSLTEAERAGGVIAMSAGNHAQGVAYHAARLGIPATIVMPKGTPFTKIQHTQDHGARVLVEGETLAEAQAFAEQLCAEPRN